VEPKYDAPAEGATKSGAAKFHEQGNPENGVEAPEGVRFELGDGAPEGVTVDSETGVVTLDDPVTETTTVPVKAVYQDGSSDTTNVVFKPAAKKTAEQVEPKWDEVSAVDEGGSVVIPNSGDALPEAAGVGALITPGEKNKGKDEWDISYDPATGALTVTPGADAEPGDFVAIDVDVFYEDAEKDEDKSSDSQRIFVQVTGDGADFVDANLGAAPLNAGEGTWKDVDFSGKHKGDAGEIEGIRGSDDSHSDGDISAEDIFSQADRFEPKWDEVSAVDEGGSVVIPNSGDALPEAAGVGALITPGEKNKGKDEWDISYDPATGALTVTPGADAEPGDFVAIDVDVFYEDAEKDEDKSSDSQRIFVQVTGDGADFVDANLGAAPLNAGEGTWKDVDFSGKHKGDAGEIEGIRGSNDHNNDDLTAGDVFTEAPTVNPVNPGDNIISGTGKPGATITVTGPNGFSTTTTVHENGQWSVDLTGGATPGTQFIVSQKDGDKNESDQVLVTVGGDNKPLPNPGSSELPGSSLGSSNFDIPKHLQCAVFAGGVTAIPLILLSPMHNMYEMMINPHLNGLREQFHRELHALDQQVRRGLGVEGHPALQFMDHINARVNEFNQQLGQVAHDNRHIGLAAAAIAVAGLSFQHCMNTQAASSSSVSLVGSSSSSQEQAPARNEAKEDNAGGIVGWFQGLFNRK
ncbi:Rib/alpha-like domain-containing protein, partial [Corynebacterium propinquum]|uniref:Rib/alpha-like domain-containing protein n=2 Tax=Corynebacterium propinquum TaxID=43769 RepID=UPI001386999E